MLPPVEKVVEFVIARAKELDDIRISAAIVAVAHLHREAHGECWTCRYEDYPCTTIGLLAGAFREHPDYEQN